MPPRTAGPIGRQVGHPRVVAAKLRCMRPGSGWSRRNPRTPTIAPNRPPAPETRAACPEFAPGTRRVATPATRARAYRSVTASRPTVRPAAHRPSSARTGMRLARDGRPLMHSLPLAVPPLRLRIRHTIGPGRCRTPAARASATSQSSTTRTRLRWIGRDESRTRVRGCRAGGLVAVTRRRRAVDANSHVVQGIGRIGGYRGQGRAKPGSRVAISLAAKRTGGPRQGRAE